MKHKIVFLDRATIEKNIVVRKPSFDHDWSEFDYTDHNKSDLILERLKEATIAIINKVPMREETLKKLPDLKMIAVAATGTDVVDKEYCKNDKIILVEDVLNTLQLVAQYHRKQVNIPVIGITGTNGKTTSKELIHAVLSSRNNCYATKGNLIIATDSARQEVTDAIDNLDMANINNPR